MKRRFSIAHTFAAVCVWQNLSDNEKRLIGEMSDGELVYPIAQTASDAGVALAEARKIVRRFQSAGLVRLGPLRDEDGLLCGRGYWLTREGLSVADNYRLRALAASWA